MHRLGAFPGAAAISLITRIIADQADDAISQCRGSFPFSDEAGLIVERGFAQASHRINHRRRAERVGLDHIQSPAFAHGSVQEEMGIAQNHILVRLGQKPRELYGVTQLQRCGFLPEGGFQLAAAHDGQPRRHAALPQRRERFETVMDPFVRREPANNDQT